MDLKSAIVLCLAIGSVLAEDYCNNMRCGEKPHVACNSPVPDGGWGPECPSDAELVNITPELQQRILDIHNKQRNQQAAGKTPHYGPAVRMGTLVWDEGLAQMAEKNARSCHYGHDKCHNTKKFYSSGQNIAKSGGRGEDKDIIESLVPIWFENEHANGKLVGWMGLIKSFKSSPNPNKEIGHFTQVVWEDAMVVGCAGSKFGQTAILVCNYGFGNMAKSYVYESGPTASKCKTGTNPDYPALCSVDEDYSEDVKHRTGWDLKPINQPNGGFSWTVPWGCDDDEDCRSMQADPSAFFSKNKGGSQGSESKPEDTQAKVTIGPDGVVHFNFPSGCDQACADKAEQDFIKSHPEYGK